MSWQAGVLLVLALTLIGGFAWFERSRPPAQIVALVGALAAISVAGRIALSPIPNVVPSTDIVLIAGYALGGAPGFAVGALTGLDLELLARAGAVDALADGRLGDDRLAGGLARRRHRREGRAVRPGGRVRARGARLRGAARPLADGDLRRRAIARSVPRALRPRPAIQHRPRRRERGARPGRRPGDGPDADPLPASLRVRVEAGDGDRHRPPGPAIRWIGVRPATAPVRPHRAARRAGSSGRRTTTGASGSLPAKSRIPG